MDRYEKVKWKGLYNAIKDVKEYESELECAFENEEPEINCSKLLVSLKSELIELEEAAKKLKRYYKTKYKKKENDK